MSILKNNKVVAFGGITNKYYHPPILSNMWSDHLLNDIQWLRGDTFSWQDGDVYKTAYDKLVEEYNNAPISLDTSLVTLKKVETDDDFVVSNFSQCSYGDGIKIDGDVSIYKIKTGSDVTTSQGLFGLTISTNDHSVWIKDGYIGDYKYVTTGPSFVQISQVNPNTTYYIKVQKSTGLPYYYISFSTDKSDWTEIDAIKSLPYFGCAQVLTDSLLKTEHFLGEVDLKGCSSDDVQLVRKVTETENSVSFLRTTSGFKIADATQEQAILDKYNSDGIAWYYILDTTNKRFKLPRTKWGFKGLRDNVGNDIEQNVLLPDITGVTGAGSGTGSKVTGAFFDDGEISGEAGGSGGSDDKIGFSAARCSGVYSGDGTNTLIDERATQMYLYFYVGEYNQTAIEQTAGVNSELFNNTLELNANNLSAKGQDYISGLGMPSSNYTTLTLGASGSTYTAPANGYFVLNKISGASGRYVNLINETSYILKEYLSNSTTNDCSVYIPAKKGDIVKCSYNLTGATNYFRFVYAEGEE